MLIRHLVSFRRGRHQKLGDGALRGDTPYLVATRDMARIRSYNSHMSLRCHYPALNGVDAVLAVAEMGVSTLP